MRKRLFVTFNEKIELDYFDELYKYSVINVVGSNQYEIRKYSFIKELLSFIKLGANDAHCRSWISLWFVIIVNLNGAQSIHIGELFFSSQMACLTKSWPRINAWQNLRLEQYWAKLSMEHGSKQILPRGENVSKIYRFRLSKRISKVIGLQVKPFWLYLDVFYSCY